MRWFAIVLIVTLCGCAEETQAQYIGSIETQAEFNNLASLPLYQKYGQVSSVKIVYDNASRKLHIVASDKYIYHYDYCAEALRFYKDLDAFNKVAYSADEDRPFLIANINYYQAMDLYTLELGPSDRMSASNLERLFDAVEKHTFFGDRLQLVLNTSHVVSIVNQTDITRTISPDKIYEGQVYQPISKYTAVGRLKIINNWEEEREEIQPSDIIVLKTIPEVFPLVSGVIVTQFQTPLSHVTILGRNRRIPICAYIHVFETALIDSLNGDVVAFEVTQDTFLIKGSTEPMSHQWSAKKRVKLKKDLLVDSLIPAKFLRERLSSCVGHKAANFGELVRYSKKVPFKTPESAFAIPFGQYQMHANSSGAQIQIDALLAQNNRERSSFQLKADLAAIQQSILEAPVDPELLNAIEAMILRLGDYRRMRFRSSTNAEDMAGFSGAGIYTSKTGELWNSEKPIKDAVKAVWASLWSYNAFMEREAYNIDHATVAMGILVHRSFPNEAVNGVAITANLYRENYLGFIVNAQLGDESVVNPNGAIRCDEFICYPDRSSSVYGDVERGIDIINYSSLNGGELVMNSDEIQELANVLELIKQRYLRSHYTKMTYFDFALDLEFKLDEDTRELYIKQMRVYNR